MKEIKNNFKKKVLDNGMTILFEKREIPIVAVSITVRCGGINETEKEKGISHYVEHMLYKGTLSRTSKEIVSEIEKKGGELNGFTAETMTSFYCKMPSKHIAIALDILGDMIKNSKFDLNELEKEREVIFEEIKMRRDNPHSYVLDKLHSMLYEGALGKDLIGTRETMNSITRDDIIKRMKDTYTPNNLILTVVGDANFSNIVEWAEKTFSLEKKEVPEYPIKLINKSKYETRKGIDQANMIFAFHGPLSNDKKYYAAEILMTLMAGGLSSRLFSEIREKRNLAYSIHGAIDSSKRYSFMYVYAGVSPKNIEKVRNLIIEEFSKVSQNIEKEELDLIKEQSIGNYLISMEDSQSQMLQLLSNEIDTKAEDFYDYEKNINEVKLEDVKEMASLAVEGKYSLFALLPEDDK